jgi:hypothetical protein
MVAVLPLAVPLVAWGLRHMPRLGSVLAALTVAASAGLFVDVRFGSGGLVAGRPDAPWGPLVKAFPKFDGSAYPTTVAVVAGVLILVLFLYDARQWRRLAELGWPAAAKR